MPKGTDIRLGPWPDGVNFLDLPDKIQDTQLTSCINFDIDNTGVLVPRRPIRYTEVNADITRTKYLMGSVTLDGETQPRAVVNDITTGPSSNFRFLGNPTAAHAVASSGASGTYKSIVQYQSKFWYIPADATTVGQSSPSSTTNPLTSVASMPWGDYGFVLKDRLFIVRKSTSELYFSTPATFAPTGSFPAPWSSTAPNSGGLIQINPGDNQPITKVVTVNNQIIIFKRDATYVFSFTASPTGDGVLRQVSADQGALDAITYNNEVYTYNARSVFKFINGYFQDIGIQLNLPNTDTIDATGINPARLNVVGKTLIFGTTPSGKTYAMNLDTGAWTMYTTPSDLSFSTGTVFSRSALGTAIFFGDGNTKIGYMLVTRGARTDQSSDGSYTALSYSFRTREYDFDDSENWKRMHAWWLDAKFDASPVGSALTYINNVQNNISSDVTDLVGSSLSYRFKTTSVGLSIPSAVSTAVAVPGATVRGVRAVISARAPVSV